MYRGHESKKNVQTLPCVVTPCCPCTHSRMQISSPHAYHSINTHLHKTHMPTHCKRPTHTGLWHWCCRTEITGFCAYTRRLSCPLVSQIMSSYHTSFETFSIFSEAFLGQLQLLILQGFRNVWRHLYAFVLTSSKFCWIFSPQYQFIFHAPILTDYHVNTPLSS